MHRVTGSIDRHVGCDLHVCAYLYLSHVEYDEIIVGKEVLPYLDILAVITVKRLFDVDQISRLAKDLPEQICTPSPLFRRKAVIFKYELLSHNQAI